MLFRSRAALAAGVRADLSEGERESRFAGHSLRAALKSFCERQGINLG